MSVKEAERLFIAGGMDRSIRPKYDKPATREEFVALAKSDGYDFTVEELNEALRSSGDSFQTYGLPPKRCIWWN